ncbi:putative cytochrome cbb3 oxidase maturation protein CcoS [Candidatus Walczuchella monophlebidarum]|uniref:Putative cytochrome cbb3 oxidase maturation protein CcoS n=2 Tax=Candidatus Walczuchella monophlebidarum TaxID=1415657 RepID=A0A068DRU7_9FLAO|nr:putative cytochrome cbb3 oxidase maturation protein CcoS [Candidatus Walczuchella monophlebidarum]
MILVSVSLGLIFLVLFIISVIKGQFSEDESPAIRLLMDDFASEDGKEIE